ncbi:hypothetical protein N7452_004238 [Penicillium brevicompactum]|uniref:Uncharacterized protein n=1 Tax=Penicillium brevicompactum TaxID=5074 RepID=A0A9W9QVD8_PENBR|nr:hypothetical protein N7452_004238 [Penicillium brevicompactum]
MYPLPYRVASDKKKLEKALRRKIARHRQVRLDDIVIVIIVIPLYSLAGKEKKEGNYLSRKKYSFDTKESTSSEKLIWRSVYSLMRCDSSICQHRPYCWVDPMGKKHYPLKSHHIKRLITYVERGGVLEGHKDVLGVVYDELYREEQDRLERDKCKGGYVIEAGLLYPPINIHLSSSQSTPYGLEISAPKAVDNLQLPSSLDIPGLRDVVVKEYTCDVMLENGLDLEQVYRDQDPSFFIAKGIKIGIARCFVEDIGKWVKNVKNVIPVLELN